MSEPLVSGIRATKPFITRKSITQVDSNFPSKEADGVDGSRYPRIMYDCIITAGENGIRTYQPQIFYWNTLHQKWIPQQKSSFDATQTSGKLVVETFANRVALAFSVFDVGLTIDVDVTFLNY